MSWTKMINNRKGKVSFEPTKNSTVLVQASLAQASLAQASLAQASRKKKRKKAFFTLPEVMISLFITAILLGVICRYFSQITILEKKIKIAGEDILEKNNLDIKLTSIFSQIIYKHFPKDPFFYMKDKRLYFHFDNGVDPDPRFSSEVAAQLFLDDKKDLILQITPPGENNEKMYREEVLMKKVKSLSFEFIKKLPEQPPSKKALLSTLTWDKEQNDIPAILKIHVAWEDDHCSFAFFLPTKRSYITYR